MKNFIGIVFGRKVEEEWCLFSDVFFWECWLYWYYYVEIFFRIEFEGVIVRCDVYWFGNFENRFEVNFFLVDVSVWVLCFWVVVYIVDGFYVFYCEFSFIGIKLKYLNFVCDG